MRIMPIFYVLRGVENAVVFAVSSVVVASRFVVELIVLPVRRFSLFWWQCSVAELAPNFTLKRDAAEARRPLAPR